MIKITTQNLSVHVFLYLSDHETFAQRLKYHAFRVLDENPLFKEFYSEKEDFKSMSLFGEIREKKRVQHAQKGIY